MAARCRIELLGGLRVLQGDRTTTRFRTRKTAALLAYLAYHLGRSRPREALIEMLWPWAQPEGGRHSLSTALTSLRRQLEPPGVPGGAVVVADRNDIALNAENVSTDVAAFEAELDQAARVTDPALRVARLEEAVNLYSGALLPGIYEPWVPAEQVRLSERFVGAVVELAKLVGEGGEGGVALSHLRRAIEAEPLREEPRRELMRLLAERGEPGAAFEVYHELLRVLDEELGEEPSPTTQELARKIERLASERPSASSVTSLAAPRLVRRRHQRKLPTGTVTLLLIDVGRDGASDVRSIQEELRRRGGIDVGRSPELVAAFSHAGDALAGAAACHLRAFEASGSRPARPAGPAMAIHTAELTAGPDGTYPEGSLHRGLRLLGAAHPTQILCSEATAGLLRYDLNGGLHLRDLGVHRLRGASASERIFQLDHPHGPATFPALKAEIGYQSHLPLQLTRFFGREPELERLTAMLSPGGARLVTLIGTPGCGKTRLAIETAARLLETFQGAGWFVSLADLRDAGRILDHALAPLGIAPQPQQAPLDQIAAWLAEQPALLVFDNFEHLTEGAGVVLALLERLPDLRCLVTSRRRLGLAGEREFAVQPLATPASAAAPEELLRNPSVQLFVDRAQTVRPDFQLTSANAGAVAELCRGLEGVPLAIELAAARSQVLPPAQLVERLGSRLDLKRGTRGSAEDRHRSLRTAIEWSLELLTPELRRFFARLAVFRSGWTLAAAEVVCEEPQALDCLTELVEWSLIMAEQGPLGPRFGMLETVREYATEVLAASGGEVIRDRHLDYFLALGERTRHEARRSKQAQSLLAADHANLLAALDWCHGSPQHVREGMRLVGAMHWFWEDHGDVALGHAESERALARDATREPTAARASALLSACCFSRQLGDVSTSRARLTESLEISRMLNDTLGIVTALKHQGCLERDQGNLAAARKTFEECLDLERRLGREEEIGRVLSHLGWVAQERGDHAAARSLYSEALARSRTFEDRMDEASSLEGLGYVAEAEGDYETATSLMSEALAVARELESPWLERNCLNSLAIVHCHRGDLASARARLHEALVISRKLGHKNCMAANLVNLAGVNLIDAAAGKEAVRAPLLECLRLVGQIGSRDPGTWGLHLAALLFAAEAREAPSLERGHELMELACCLLSAAEEIRRAAGFHSLMVGEEDIRPTLVEALGQATFDGTWKQGEAMAFEDMIACAIEALEGLAAPARGSRSDTATSSR